MKNNYKIIDNIVEIYTAKGQTIIIDLIDFDLVKHNTWRLNSYGYVIATTNHETIYMHKLIKKVAAGMEVDHRDLNKLNNRRNNLRECTHSQNLMNGSVQSNNTSGVKGVHWVERDKKWRVMINVNKKEKYVGAFKNKDDAIAARLKAEEEYYGEFGNQNK